MEAENQTGKGVEGMGYWETASNKSKGSVI